MKKFFTVVIVSLGLAINAYAQQQTQDQQFEGFNLEGYKNDGNKAWDVKGDTADVQGSKITISNVNANSYGEQNMNVTAQTGEIDQTSGQMHLEKDVIITSEEGSQLLTDSLNWDRNKDLVTTEDEVLITDERLTATGKGMQAQPGLKTAQINEDVRLTVNTEPEKKNGIPVTITSDGPMVMDQAVGKATFKVNVVAVRENQTLKADEIQVYFDTKANAIKEMVCIGNVQILQGENKTYAEKAVYNAATQKLTLSGRPKLIFITEGEGAITAFGD